MSSTAQQLRSHLGAQREDRLVSQGAVTMPDVSVLLSHSPGSQHQLPCQLGRHVNTPLASQPLQTSVLSGLLLAQIPIHVKFLRARKSRL